MRKVPDILDEYKGEFGYFGPSLHMGVAGLRNQDQKTTSQNANAAGQRTLLTGSPQIPQGHIKPS